MEKKLRWQKKTGQSNRSLTEIVISLTPVQISELNRLKGITKMSRSALIRQAVSMLLGGYSNVLRKPESK